MNAARSTGKEFFFIFFFFPLASRGRALPPVLLRCEEAEEQKKKKAVLHAAYRAHEVWDIFFHPVQQRPCKCCLFLSEGRSVRVCGEGEEFLPSSLTIFNIIRFFGLSSMQDVLSAKGG